MKVAVAAALLTFAGAGCVKIDGGAVEISWVVRSTAGAAITDCSCAGTPTATIAAVRLVLIGVGEGINGNMPCAGQAQCDFPCQRQSGSTAFDIPETRGSQRYGISVEAVDANGARIESPDVSTPAPILREVVRGQPTETEAFQIVAPCRDECRMNGSGVCARP